MRLSARQRRGQLSAADAAALRDVAGVSGGDAAGDAVVVAMRKKRRK
eukprot:gene18341-62340_t